MQCVDSYVQMCERFKTAFITFYYIAISMVRKSTKRQILQKKRALLSLMTLAWFWSARHAKHVINEGYTQYQRFRKGVVAFSHYGMQVFWAFAVLIVMCSCYCLLCYLKQSLSLLSEPTCFWFWPLPLVWSSVLTYWDFSRIWMWVIWALALLVVMCSSLAVTAYFVV